MIMQIRKGLQLDDLHENNNKEFSNQSSELYNASIANDYQEKIKRKMRSKNQVLTCSAASMKII
ncbi:hypothetical protein SLEP1_g18860 [Rubroshorea leprosula]|uniref:Uncharacterized protein n=1 Tax=Rubroshorea leprosula TaxID=152421 RepID=A0AAV5IYY9_9ROSI|nr:hypothetical protein SLEP1_g18860 [Rubroshorea leprosula]